MRGFFCASTFAGRWAHQTTSEVWCICKISLEEKGMEEISNQDSGWQFQLQLFSVHATFLTKKGEQPWQYMSEFDHLIPKKDWWCWRGNSFRFSFTHFFDLHPKSISPKNSSRKISKQFYLVTKLVVFFGKISRGPGRSTSLEENDRFRSKADFWRFDTDTCTGWCWKVGFCDGIFTV